jgi:hypothetical protein
VTRSRLGRALLVLAFLFAQYGALAHHLSHSAAAAKYGGLLDRTNGNPLCAQHGALDTVLGALSGAQRYVTVAEERPAHFPAGNSPAASTPRPAPVSRGPPTVL